MCRAKYGPCIGCPTCGFNYTVMNPTIGDLELGVSRILGVRYHFSNALTIAVYAPMIDRPAGLTMIEGIVISWNRVGKNLFVHFVD